MICSSAALTDLVDWPIVFTAKMLNMRKFYLLLQLHKPCFQQEYFYHVSVSLCPSRVLLVKNNGWI